MGEVAKLFRDCGIINITAFISPYIGTRQFARDLGGDNDFIEIFTDYPLKICEKRDPKGVYRKAREGLIRDFTGISPPYESPQNPEIHLQTDKMNVEECMETLILYLLNHRYLEK